MSVTYHVDWAQYYNGTQANDGLSSGAPWGGGPGAMRAIKAAVAGDTILWANAVTPGENRSLTNLDKISIADTTNFDVGDLVETVPPGASARIAVVETNDYILTGWVTDAIEVGNTITPDGGTTTQTVTAIAKPGIFIHEDFAANGSAAGPITIKGVASDWTTPEYTLLSCSSACDGITIHDVSGWTIRRVDIYNPALYGVNKATDVGQTGWLLENVRVTNAGARAFHNLTYLQYGAVRFCWAVNATTDGFYGSPGSGRMEYCTAIGCGDHGVAFPGYYTTLDHFLLAGNGGCGIDSPGPGITITHCTIDDNDLDGIKITAANRHGVRILHNRITNNGLYGVTAPDTPPGCLSDYNVFYGNPSGSFDTFVGGDNDHGPVDDASIPVEANRDVTGDGYTDQAGGDYALVGSAVGRRWPIALDDTHSVFATAGFAPRDLALPSVRTHGT